VRTRNEKKLRGREEKKNALSRLTIPQTRSPSFQIPDEHFMTVLGAERDEYKFSGRLGRRKRPHPAMSIPGTLPFFIILRAATAKKERERDEVRSISSKREGLSDSPSQCAIDMH